MRRALAAAALAALTLTGCSESADPAPAEEPAQSQTGSESAEESPSAGESASESASGAPAGEQPADDAVEVEIEGGSVEPRGKRVDAGVGETITFRVESDRAAELHVHSVPEQVLDVQPGESTLTLVIDRPGLVEVEEHESGVVIVQLEVR